MKCRAATSDFRITFRFIMHHTHITNRVMQQQKFSQQAIIMLYFSGRVCYDLAGVRPVTTKISFEALEKMPFPYDMEGSENLSLR